jgi:hypothetical protein
MLTRKLTNRIASVGLVLSVGLLSQTATATEELVVNGADVAALAQEGEALFQSDMKEYVESLNHRLKATLDKELKEIAAPKLTLALNEAASRG